MKKLLTTSVALVTVFAALASTAFAAPSKHRAPVANDTMASYGSTPTSSCWRGHPMS